MSAVFLTDPTTTSCPTVPCIAFLGFPNVGKSSLINGLVGRKVVSVSRTPGHTRYFQTYFLTPSVKLCDCPGLIFPSLLPRQLQVGSGGSWSGVGRREGGPHKVLSAVHRFWLESTPSPRSRSPTLPWATWPPESPCRPCCTCATQRQRTLQLSTPGVPGTSVKVGFLLLLSSLAYSVLSTQILASRKEGVACFAPNFFYSANIKNSCLDGLEHREDWVWG